MALCHCVYVFCHRTGKSSHSSIPFDRQNDANWLWFCFCCAIQCGTSIWGRLGVDQYCIGHIWADHGCSEGRRCAEIHKFVTIAGIDSRRAIGMGPRQHCRRRFCHSEHCVEVWCGRRNSQIVGERATGKWLDDLTHRTNHSNSIPFISFHAVVVFAQHRVVDVEFVSQQESRTAVRKSEINVAGTFGFLASQRYTNLE